MAPQSVPAAPILPVFSMSVTVNNNEVWICNWSFCCAILFHALLLSQLFTKFVCIYSCVFMYAFSIFASVWSDKYSSNTSFTYWKPGLMWCAHRFTKHQSLSYAIYTHVSDALMLDAAVFLFRFSLFFCLCCYCYWCCCSFWIFFQTSDMCMCLFLISHFCFFPSRSASIVLHIHGTCVSLLKEGHAIMNLLFFTACRLMIHIMVTQNCNFHTIIGYMALSTCRISMLCLDSRYHLVCVTGLLFLWLSCIVLFCIFTLILCAILHTLYVWWYQTTKKKKHELCFFFVVRGCWSYTSWCLALLVSW